ncbi:MAG: ATP-binding protein [Syntrophomonadaceae bacterium]
MFNELPWLLAGLSIYHSLARDPVLHCLEEMALAGVDDSRKIYAVSGWSRVSFSLWQEGLSFKHYLTQKILQDDNPFSCCCEKQGYEGLEVSLKIAVQRDLRLLQKVFNLDLENEARLAGANTHWPQSELKASEFAVYKAMGEKDDWADLVAVLAGHHRRHSRGLLARYSALRWSSEDGLIGIEKADPICLDDLVGYHAQKKQVCENTEKLLLSYPANHVLLYGPRGTGKSSLIKALLHEYSERGLHIVELNRDDLWSLGRLVEELQDYAVPCIIFIDDLSFEESETQYKGFKAVLEGSLQARPAHVLIYATSNRRHLIREYFSDREGPGNEIHLQETLQEKLSLADRFGLTISFPPVGQELYLEMVEKMAADEGLSIDPDLLRERALAWERRRHGPSGRSARQFIDSLEKEYYQKR